MQNKTSYVPDVMVNLRLFHIFSAQENRKLIGMTSCTGISGVLKYIRNSNVNITVKCFPNLNLVNPQKTS